MIPYRGIALVWDTLFSFRIQRQVIGYSYHNVDFLQDLDSQFHSYWSWQMGAKNQNNNNSTYSRRQFTKYMFSDYLAAGGVINGCKYHQYKKVQIYSELEAWNHSDSRMFDSYYSNPGPTRHVHWEAMETINVKAFSFSYLQNRQQQPLPFYNLRQPKIPIRFRKNHHRGTIRPYWFRVYLDESLETLLTKILGEFLTEP